MQKLLIITLIFLYAVALPVALRAQPVGVPTNIPEPGYSTHGCIPPIELREDHEEATGDPDYDYFETYIGCVKMYKEFAENDMAIVQEAIKRSEEEIAAAEAILARRPKD